MVPNVSVWGESAPYNLKKHGLRQIEEVLLLMIDGPHHQPDFLSLYKHQAGTRCKGTCLTRTARGQKAAYATSPSDGASVRTGARLVPCRVTRGAQQCLYAVLAAIGHNPGRGPLRSPAGPTKQPLTGAPPSSHPQGPQARLAKQPLTSRPVPGGWPPHGHGRSPADSPPSPPPSPCWPSRCCCVHCPGCARSPAGSPRPLRPPP